MFTLQHMWISLFISIAVILYSVLDKRWNLLTISIILAFISGLVIYFKLMGGAALL